MAGFGISCAEPLGSTARVSKKDIKEISCDNRACMNWFRTISSGML
jgi:hypothetical protein